MEKVVKYYQSFDEWGRLDREPVEFMVNYHHILSNLPANGHILDIGAGPGKYAIELAKSGYQITLADLTPQLVELAKSKAKDAGMEQQFSGFHVADARDLSLYAEEQFEATLMLGPLYHLQTEEDRMKAVNELWRVTKRGGLVFVAVMSRMRQLTTSLLYPEAWKPNHTVDGIEEFMETGVFNHTDEGRFTGVYYFNIEDIQPFMESQGFQSIKLISSGSIAGAMKQEQWDYWRQRGEDEYNKVMEIVMKASESPYIQGVSSHLLYVGRKSSQPSHSSIDSLNK